MLDDKYKIVKKVSQQVSVLEKKLFKTQEELQRVETEKAELETMLKGLNSLEKSQTITIKSANRIDFVKIDNILHCTADTGYTEVHLLDGRIILATKPLTKFEQILEEHPTFFKISKSCIVNTSHIVSFRKDINQVELVNNLKLDVSRRRRIEFLKTI
ncbi:LytTR family transcriptional regulator [bacterium]|nr:LytTR family transcriptional regulator [bacterium]